MSAAAIVISTVPKSAHSHVRVAIDQIEGKTFVDVRIFEGHVGEGNGPLPTKKGVALRLDKLPALIAALQAAEAEARRRGMIPSASPKGVAA